MELPVYDERGGAFARLRNARVLIYWPHGLGDFVHFGYVAPLLEPSNAYFITRFGDDFVHLYDDDAVVTPIFSGIRACGDGSTFGARHLGVNFKKIRNGTMRLDIPEPLLSRTVEAKIDAVLYTDYPENTGASAFPFQTKARALARNLMAPSRLGQLPMATPLQSSLGFAAPPKVRVAVEERLRRFVAPGERLLVLSAGGHTSLEKIWPEEDVRAFAATMRLRDPHSRTVAIEARAAGSIGRDPALLPSTSDLFGDLDAPFAHILLALIEAADAFVGVPSGPLHAALAMHACPVVGIWLRHHPDWYDEPHARSVHLVGPYVCARRLERRKATTTRPAAFVTRVLRFPKESPHADDAADALELLR